MLFLSQVRQFVKDRLAFGHGLFEGMGVLGPCAAGQRVFFDGALGSAVCGQGLIDLRVLSLWQEQLPGFLVEALLNLAQTYAAQGRAVEALPHLSTPLQDFFTTALQGWMIDAKHRREEILTDASEELVERGLGKGALIEAQEGILEAFASDDREFRAIGVT